MKLSRLLLVLALAFAILFAVVLIPFIQSTSMPIPMPACARGGANLVCQVPPFPALGSVAYCYLGYGALWLNGTYFPMTKSTYSHPSSIICPAPGAVTQG